MVEVEETQGGRGMGREGDEEKVEMRHRGKCNRV